MILANALIFGVIVLFAWEMLDRRLGTPLCEKVEVKERRFVPLNSRIGPSNLHVEPDTWILCVVNSTGEGCVRVTQELYERTQKGDHLFVTGVKGRLTGRWHLDHASKKS